MKNQIQVAVEGMVMIVVVVVMVVMVAQVLQQRMTIEIFQN